MDKCGQSLPLELEQPAQQMERLLRIHEQVAGQAGIDLQRKAISKFPLADLPEVSGLDGTDVIPRAIELHTCFLNSTNKKDSRWLPSLTVQELDQF